MYDVTPSLRNDHLTMAETTDKPDETELLIRSTSTILSLVNPQVPPNSKPDKKTATLCRQLDRITLLFVTEEGSHAAVTVAKITANSMEVVVAAGEAAVTNERARTDSLGIAIEGSR